jgi:hypothetical protein
MMSREDPTPVVRKGVDALAQLVTLPATPVEAEFEEVPRGTPGGLGPTDYVLVALMRFDRAELESIAHKAGSPRPGSRISATANRPWLPPAVRAHIEPFDDHSVTLHGQKFDAAPFLKAPFSSGYFVIVEGTQLVLLSVQTS